jgi:hypothetical protein
MKFAKKPLLSIKKSKNKANAVHTYVQLIFNKEKIFLPLFWQHIWDKQKWQDRMRRLKYFKAALELIRFTRFDPISKQNPNHPEEILHRFAGATLKKGLFYVQIKENKKTKQKYLISIFPWE